MYDSTFNYTFVHYHLRKYLKSIKLPTRTSQAVDDEVKQLNSAVRKLATTVSIPASHLDDTIEEILKKDLGHLPETTALGLSVDIGSVDHISDDLYKLTVLGCLEANLRDYVVNFLRCSLTDFKSYADKQERAHQVLYDRLWQEYELQLSEFEIGDLAYDYDGPIYPKPPEIGLFDRDAAILARKAELEKLDLGDPAVVLDVVPIEPRLLGDMLHEHFEYSECINDIIDGLDFAGLNRDHVVHFLRTVDFYFPDTDILQRGFLANVLLNDIAYKYAKKRPQIDIDFYIGELFRILEQDVEGKEFLTAYNQAAKENDSLQLQRLWFYLSQLCHVLVRHLNSPVLDDQENLAKKIKTKLHDFKTKAGKTLSTLIKVFPTDDVDHLFYPGKAEGDNGPGHYPSQDVQLPLKPIFHTLEQVARETHEALVKCAGKKSNVKKTNVISAMLSFVVSIEPEDKGDGIIRERHFINIPLNFDYSTVLVSIDDVFDGRDDLERSIGFDLECGMRVANRKVAMPVDQADEAKQRINRMIETLALDGDDKEKMRLKISQAKIANPVCLDYLMASDIAKSTGHHHSERILNQVLKKVKNIRKVLLSLRVALQDLKVPAGTYTIHSGALLVYSYPNSICDGCSVSFLALQNSYQAGFLSSFIQEVNSPASTSQRIRLRTRGFDATRGGQDPNEFGVTIIAGSSKVFSNDAYAKLVVNRPEAKFTCREMPYTFSKPGINLFSTARRKDRVFEFTAGSALHHDNQLTEAYSSVMFMSGSKNAKISSKKKKAALEKQVKEVISSVHGTVSKDVPNHNEMKFSHESN